MKFRMPLFLQILSVLILHLSLLCMILMFTFNTQFGPGWEALMQTPVGDRIESIGFLISHQLGQQSKDDWNHTLDAFGKAYGVKFYIFNSRGKEIAGEPITLPDAVKERIAQDMAPFRHIAEAKPVDGSKPVPDFFRAPMHPPRFIMNTLNPPGFWIATSMPGAPPFIQFGGRRTAARHPLNLTHRPLPPIEGIFIQGTPMPGSRPPAFEHGQPLPPPEAPETGAIGVFHTAENSEPGPIIFGQGNMPPILAPTVITMPFPHMEHHVLLASVQNIWDCKLLADFRLLGTVASSIVVLSILIWLPFAYRITRGIREVTDATQKIANGNFDVRVKTGHRDELDSLADSVNSMSDRLESFVTGQRRFLGDIAHELCSPVSRLQIALELLREAPESSRAQLITDIQEEAEEMSALINELLAFSKASLRGQEIELTEVCVEKLLSDVVTRLNAEKLVQISCDPNVHVSAEPLLLERAVANVLRNSIRYAAASGIIDIAVTSDLQNVTIKISDSGPGVPEEALPRLGQPFYRPEPSRNRNLGGAGLGLAIVKTCVESCGGTFTARNGEQKGLIVEIKLTACDKLETAHSDTMKQEA